MKFASSTLTILAILVASFFPAFAAVPPQDTASIMGTVSDATGAVVAGATITVRDGAGSQHTAVSNDQGNYVVTGLKAGTYDFSVSAQGYKDFAVSGLALKSNESLPLDAALGTELVAQASTSQIVKPKNQQGTAKGTGSQAQARVSAKPASMTGTVSDPSGAPIVAATVTLTNASGVKQTASSDEKGNYSVKGLVAGTYDLSVSAKGFKVFEAQGIMLNAGDSLPVDASLEAASADAGTVNAQAQQPETPAQSSETPAPAPAPAVHETQANVLAQLLSAAQSTPTVVPSHQAQKITVSKDSGTIAGTVTDQTGAVISGATITVTGVGGVKKVVTSNEQGNYVITGLPGGTYDLAVAAPKFSVFDAKGITVAVGESMPLDAMLQPAGEVTEVNVEGQKVAQVETENAQVSGTITEKEVVKLGLNGRVFSQLIALAPGVSNQTGQDEAKVGVQGSAKFSVNGGRVEYNTFDVDGSDVLNTGLNGATSTLMVYPSLDAIQEVKVLTSNYGAQYGKSASGTVLVTTKSGGESFHGVAYEFLRNEFFNSRNFFDTNSPKAPLYRRNDFGATLGGPLYIPGVFNKKKDKTFFFFSEEVRLERSPFQYNQAVPSVAERQGDFNDVCPTSSNPGSFFPNFSLSQFPDCPRQGSPDNRGNYPAFQGNLIVGPNAGVLDRNALAILSSGVIPLPNASAGCNSSIGSCYVTTVSPSTYWREELFRLDHNFSQSTKGTFRYIHDAWDTTVPIPQWGFVTNSFPTIQNRFVGPGTSLVAHLTRTMSSTMLADLVFSYTNSTITLTNTNGPGAQFQRPAELDAPCAPDPNSPNPDVPIVQCPIGHLFDNGFGGKMPGVVIAGNNPAYGGNGFAVDAGYMPWKHTNPTYSFGGSISKVAGKHTLQFGSQFVISHRNQTSSVIGAASGDIQGLVTFSNVSNHSFGNAFADFLIHPPLGGQNQIISFTQDSAQGRYYQRYMTIEPYIQDDWKVTPQLTVNMGVRFSLFGLYHEKHNNVFNWVPGAFDQQLASEVKISPDTGQLLFAKGNHPVPLDLNNLDPHITNGLVHCGINGVPDSCMNGHLFNPAPRIGFAWDPTGSGKFSIRGGYGMFFEHGTANEANTGSLEASAPQVLSVTQNFPFSWSCIGNVGTIDSQTRCPGSGPGAYPISVTSIPTKAVWPYVQQWSFSIQTELPKSMVATFAYVGSKGTHLTAERQLNQLVPVDPKANSGLFLDGNPFGPHEPLIPILSGNGTSAIGDCSGFGHQVGAPTSFVLLNGTVVGPDQPAYQNLQAACFGFADPSAAPNPNSLRQFAPGIGNIYSVENIADSSYHAFQSTLRRTAGPLTLGLSYSYSHSIDDASDRSEATFVNSFDLGSNKASSSFDQRHLLAINYVYELPSLRGFGQWIKGWAHEDESDATTSMPASENHSGWANRLLSGWEISGITLYAKGQPFSVINGGGSNGVSVLDNAGVANGAGAGSYPDIVGNPHGTRPTGGQNARSVGPLLLDPTAFAAPRGLTFGNAGRNSLNNPGRLNFDMALLKRFSITESTGLEFRAEAFNVFNHTQFRIYDPDLGNRGNNVINCYGGANSGISGYSAAGGDGVDCLTGSSFLHPVSAHRPRTIQLGLKFSY